MAMDVLDKAVFLKGCFHLGQKIFHNTVKYNRPKNGLWKSDRVYEAMVVEGKGHSVPFVKSDQCDGARLTDDFANNTGRSLSNGQFCTPE